MRPLLGALGRQTLSLLRAALAVCVLMVETIRHLFPWRGKGLRWRSAIEQVVAFGVRSLPVVGMICFLIGVIMAIQAAHTLERWGATRFVANLVSVSALRELAPLMTAILITGHSGSAITAEIGTMKVGEEIAALRVMGINPIRFLVVPKFLGMLVAVPCVTLLAMFIMVLGGWVASVTVIGVESAVYVEQAIKSLVEKDLYTGLAKSVVFATIICWVGVWRGFQVAGGAEGVGKSTTSSVVTSITLIILADLLFTVLFYFV